MRYNRLENYWTVKENKAFLVIHGGSYDVKATLDAKDAQWAIYHHWRLRTDGHIVNQDEDRLSHMVWNFAQSGDPYTPQTPKTLVHKNGDILDYSLGNLGQRYRHATIQLTPQVPEEGTVDLPSTGLPLGTIYRSRTDEQGNMIYLPPCRR